MLLMASWAMRNLLGDAEQVGLRLVGEAPVEIGVILDGDSSESQRSNEILATHASYTSDTARAAGMAAAAYGVNDCL
jgi:hypothetical protein